MNKTMFGVLTFAAGAVIGSAVTWKLVKTRYEQITQEEINSVKEYYGQKFNFKKFEPKKFEPKKFELEQEEEYDEHKPVDIHEVKEYLDEIRKTGYDAGVNNNSVREGVVTMVDSPRVIPPTEFREIEEYETITLFYHSDGVLADDFGNPIVDVMGMIGIDPLDHFGEYEPDSVYVRNDHLKADIEILRDESKSTEVKRLDYHLTNSEDDV